MSDLPIYSETDETGDLGIDLVSQKIKIKIRVKIFA